MAAAIPIIMGQNIGTCVTALLSSVGTNKNARRAAVVHLTFNIIGTVIWLTVFCILDAVFAFALWLCQRIRWALPSCTASLMCFVPRCCCPPPVCWRSSPALSFRTVRPRSTKTELDQRLMATPSIAIERCRIVTGEMATNAVDALKSAVEQVEQFDPERAARIRTQEEETDRYEDDLGTYLVKLSTHAMSDQDSTESAKLLHVIGDFERISDHAVNILESAEEIREKKITFPGEAERELRLLMGAVDEVP